MILHRVASKFAATLLGGAALVALAGCEEPKQKVLDIKAPGVDIEVEKSRSGTDVHIDNKSDPAGTRVEVEAPPAGSPPGSGPKIDVETGK